MQNISFLSFDQTSRDFQEILNKPSLPGAILRATVAAVAVTIIAGLISLLGASIVSAIQGVVVIAGIGLAGYFLFNNQETSFENAIYSLGTQCLAQLGRLLVSDQHHPFFRSFLG